MAKSPGELSEIVNKVLTDNTAQSVLNHLKALESNRERVRTRWVWELLQNARDASVDSGAKLVTCIERRDDELVFKHNGEKFSLEEIAHLIYHGSTKIESKETLGQYGSGFLTTHLLSPEINVSGRIKDGRYFDFQMRREISLVSELRASMQNAEKKFEDSLSYKPTDDDFTTKFRYPLIDNVLEVVDAGIASLKRYAPFVLVFNRNFSTIDIKISDKFTSFTVTKCISLEKTNLEQISISKTENEDQKIQEYILAHGDRASIAIPIESIEDDRECLSIQDTPRLFLGFPLIGTENFSFPVIINSLKFTPTENRDGVYLGQSDNQTNADNQAVIEEAGELLIKLLGFAASSNWKAIYLLGEFTPIQSQDWLNSDWLRGYIKEFLIPEIRRTPALFSEEGVIATEKSIIPFTEQEAGDEGIEALWDLLDGITNLRGKLTRRNESIGWCNSVESWASILECKITDLNEIMDGPKLAIHIDKNSKNDDQEYGQHENLQLLLREEVAAVEWLNQLCKFLGDYGFGDLNRTRSIILDQAGYLNRLDNLHRDQGISEELKDIADLLEWNIRKKLRDTRLTALQEETGAGDWDGDYVIGELVRRLRDRSDKNPDSLFAKGSVRLFSWIVGQRRWTLLRDFPVFVQELDDDNRRVIKLENDAEEDAQPLAPVSAWTEDLQRFSDLFPGRYTLADEFFESTPYPAIWKILDEKGFLRRNVMIVRDVPFKTFLPDEHLADDADHETSERVTITSVAFMTKDDVGIMARVRQSQHRARLFWQFITEWLALRDPNGLEIREASCICENDHRYYPAQWLIPLKNNKWIPQGERRAERATAASLANLLRKSEWDSSSLSKARTRRLLEAIGVSHFDLMRELFVSDDDTRTAVNNVLMDMLEAARGNVDRLSQARRYLVHLEEDPKLSQVVQDHLDRSRRVQENQKLGARVEDLVKQSLEKMGFKVQRTEIGSDFEIEYDDVVKLELNRSGRSWLVEVKAARDQGIRQGIRMTDTQAKTAKREGDRFLLCVVPVQNVASELELNIEDSMRFVVDIGSRVAPLCDNLSVLQNMRENVTSDDFHGVRLEVEAGTVRIRVSGSVWQDDGFPLAELSNRLK